MTTSPFLVRRPAGRLALRKLPQPRRYPELLAQHSITPDEYERILDALGRVPSLTELGIYR